MRTGRTLPSGLLRLGLAGLLAALAPGCSENPVGKDDDVPDDGLDRAGGMLRVTARLAGLLYHETAAADRVRETLEASEPPQVERPAELRTIGPPRGDSVLPGEARTHSLALQPLFKPAAKASAGAPGTADSIVWVYADSARGSIYVLRTYSIAGASGSGASLPGHGRDSIRLRWPLSMDDPVALSSDIRRDYADGSVELAALADEDGDGTLNRTSGGRNVRVRQTWILARGSKHWVSILHSDHGPSTQVDSLGNGRILSWVDSLEISGRVRWWRRVFDGDGDGFALKAPGGIPIRIRCDDFEDLGGGMARHRSETFGPGPDGDFTKESDNDLHASSSRVVDGQGDFVSQSTSVDDDGDGLLWNPAAGSGNRIRETTTWYHRPGYRHFIESMLLMLGPDRNVRIAAYNAEAVTSANEPARISISGPVPFGPADTVSRSETVIFPAQYPETRDSIVRVTRFIPGRMDTDADDVLLSWSTATHFNPASDLYLRHEAVSSAIPLAPGDDIKAGSWTAEEHLSGFNSSTLVQVRTRHDFDKTAGFSAWKTVRVTRSGDSSVASGRLPGPGASGAGLATIEGKGFRASGLYDRAAGTFRDTVAWLDSLGRPAGTRIAAGRLAGGAGEYAITAIGADGKAAQARVKAVTGTDAWHAVTYMAAGDTAAWKSNGDSTVLEKTFPDWRVTLNLRRSQRFGDYFMEILGLDTGGVEVLRGTLGFDVNGSGGGQLEEITGEPESPTAEFRSDANGTVHLNIWGLP